MKFRLIAYFLLISCIGVFSQNSLKFHTLSPKGGLSYDGIVGIEQDNSGFMWFMLDNNLFRYDGYEYKSYNLNFQSDKELRNIHFYNMAKDKDGNLFVSTQSGLFKFNTNLDKFVQESDIPIKSLYVDNLNQFWFNTSEGLAYWDEEKNLVYPEFENKKFPLNKSIYCENGNDLYFFSNFGQIYRYNRNSRSIEDCTNLNKLFEGASLVGAQIHNNKLWMLTSNFKLIGIDLSNHQVTFEQAFPHQSKYRIMGLLISENGKLWIGTNNGVYVFDPINGKTELYRNNQNDKFSIPHNSVWTMMKDSQDNIWIGTYMGSVAYVNPHDVKIFESRYLSVNGLNKVPVSGFAEDDNKIYIATEGGGVNIMDKKNGNFNYWEQNTDRNSLSSNYTKSMVKDDWGNIWISTFRGGLNRYNPVTNQFTHFRTGGNREESVLNDNLRKILLAPDSGIWIIYLEHSGNFSFYSFMEHKFLHFNLKDGIGKDMANDYIYDFCNGRNNKLWFITSHSLISFDTVNIIFEEFPIESSKNNTASTLCMDDQGKLWIGTFGNEFINFDPENKTFQYYTDILQDINTEIYSINYTNSRIWMGTNNGLNVYDIDSENCKVFNESDGTQGDVYYPLSTMKVNDNRLYFGGTSGFTIIDLEDIGHNPVKPRIIFSDFYIDNKSVFEHSEKIADFGYLNHESTIKLNHKQQNFGFKISSNNYLNANKNLFRYRLKNFDNRWLTVSTVGRIIQYSKIPAGTYYFEAQSANNDGVWGDVVSIKIVRKIAPWFSIPALLLYFLLVSIIITYFISSYRRQKKLELKLYLESVEREKNEEIHSNQLKFLTNISHDLKTPLTLIMATINRLREEGMKEYYYKILNSNSERLLNMLNDLLDFRKVSSKNMRLNVSQGNLNQFIKKISSEFQNYAVEKKIDFRFEATNPKLENIYFDKSVMEKILLNLLNNAFKYTLEGGTIWIVANVEVEKSVYKDSFTVGDKNGMPPNECFYVAVRDSGVGITKESIDKVFERYYRVKSNNENKHLGTGIGLALVKELVLLHKGVITIFSERDRGTDFVLQFSCNDKTYDADEINQFIFEETVVKSQMENINNTQTENQSLNNIYPDPLLSDVERKEKTILIAEDNVDLRMLIKSSLEEHYNIIGFNNGKEALEYLKKEDADLIVSDIMMPEMDGISFCKSVKESVETSHIPFVLLTAKTGIESRLEGSESGADLYFEKPIDLTLLKLSISNIFKQQDVLREHYAKNYFADISEITTNKEDNNFLTDIVRIISSHLSDPQLDVNFLAEKMTMSRSKLYSKLKTLTGKSVVEFILSNRLRHAAKLLIESDINIQEAMFAVGIESQSYFATAFKKEFGLPPSKFVLKFKEGRGE